MPASTVRMTLIEKCCRVICTVKEIDPDAIVCPLMPVFVNAAPLINGFFVPPNNVTCKAWELFKPYMEMMLLTLEQAGDDEYFDDKISDNDTAIFKTIIKMILDE